MAGRRRHRIILIGALLAARLKHFGRPAFSYYSGITLGKVFEGGSRETPKGKSVGMF